MQNKTTILAVSGATIVACLCLCALYLVLVYGFGLAVLSWSVNRILEPVSLQGECGYETGVFFAALAILAVLPPALMWYGKIAQGFLAYVACQILALIAGIAFHSFLLSRHCLI
jgi:hypothetical protein